jgi:hypothetical protein
MPRYGLGSLSRYSIAIGQAGSFARQRLSQHSSVACKCTWWGLEEAGICGRLSVQLTFDMESAILHNPVIYVPGLGESNLGED